MRVTVENDFKIFYVASYNYRKHRPAYPLHRCRCQIDQDCRWADSCRDHSKSNRYLHRDRTHHLCKINIIMKRLAICGVKCVCVYPFHHHLRLPVCVQKMCQMNRSLSKSTQPLPVLNWECWRNCRLCIGDRRIQDRNRAIHQGLCLTRTDVHRQPIPPYICI